MSSFKDYDLSSHVQKALEDLGFVKPTSIQEKTIPYLLSSEQDLIGSAQTGTGKTAAFGVPSVHLTDLGSKKPQTIILCPTRELCIQIANDIKSYSKYVKGLSIVAVYGGASMDTQIRGISRGAQIVVGTPGRTKDLIKRKKLFLGDIKRVILDEADEMLTMGFKEDLDDILSSVPRERQTLLFSATMSKKIQSITKTYMNNPLQISAERVNTSPDNVKHVSYIVPASNRYDVLKRIADMNPSIYGITFCRTRRETKDVSNKLMQDGYNADALHGDLSQAQRDEVMHRFRKGQLQILVATDVAARGLDVDNLSHVINYNLPDDPEVYIHRSGRTGRAGKKGISIAITHSREKRRIQEIERISKISFSYEKVPTGKDICQTQLYTLIDKIKKVKVDEQQIEPFLPTIYEKLEQLDREDLIKHFVSSEFNTFLSYYKNARDINEKSRDSRDSRGFSSRGSSSRGSSSRGSESRRQRGPRDRDSSGFTRLYINAGKQNNLNPARLMGLVNEGLRSGDAKIGKIEILKSFSFFEIEKGKHEKLINGLNGSAFEDITLSIEVSKEKKNSNDGGFRRERFKRGKFKGKGKGAGEPSSWSKGRGSSSRNN